MALASKPYRHAALAAVVAVASAAVTAPSRVARADDSGTVSLTGKGIAGGALLGAEVVTMVESIAGVHPVWAYAVGAIVGAGGGGVGGYFVEQGSSDGKVPMYMLAGGLALVIPAVVLTLDATRYRPEEGTNEDNAPTGPAAEPGVPGGSVGGSAPASAPSGAGTAPQSAPVPAAAPAPAVLPGRPLLLRRGDVRSEPQGSAHRGARSRGASSVHHGRAAPVRHAGRHRASPPGGARRVLAPT